MGKTGTDRLQKKFNRQKRCNICGACFPKMDEIDFDKLDEEEKKKRAESSQGQE